MTRMYLQQREQNYIQLHQNWGELKGQIDNAGNVSLQFTPDDPDNNDYDLKILKTFYNTNLTGIWNTINRIRFLIWY